MEFVRKKKRGQNQKVRRTWFSEEGYRIIWRKEVYGVRVPARFQACVRVLVPYSDGQLRPMWDFVNRNRRLMKTLKAAEEECEKHKRLWTKACEATGIRALKELFGGKLPLGLPLWARKKMDRRLYAILTDNRPDEVPRRRGRRVMHREFATVFRRTRPRRSYKNFGLFCLAHGSDFRKPLPLPRLPRARNRSTTRTDPPCPVEGNKYRRTIRCTACGGSGKGTKEACRQAYQQVVEAYRQEKAEYDRLVRLRRQALQRLTKDEISALRELGV